MSNFVYPRRPIIRFFLRRLAAGALFALSDFRVEGRENIPRHTPAIIAANHFHYADPVAMMCLLPWQTEYIAGTHRPNAPALVAKLPDLYGALLIHRGSVSRDAMRNAQHVLDQNGLVMVFPEAGAWADVLRPARPGTALLAAQSGVPVVPIGIAGMTAVLKAKRPRITVRIGRPIGPFATTKKGRAKRAQLETISEQIMRAIALQLPEDRHGVYAADPVQRAAAQQVAAYPYDNLHRERSKNER